MDTRTAKPAQKQKNRPLTSEEKAARRLEEVGDKAALAEVRESLLALPREVIDRPLEHIARVASEAMAFVDQARANGRSDERLDRIPVLARALRAANLAHLFLPPLDVDPGLAAAADTHFCALERVADDLVREGRVGRADLPRSPGSSERDRCAWMLDLVRFFRERGLPARRASFTSIERLVRAYRPWAAESPERVQVSELRDRAYTALRSALEETKDDGPVSGVFRIAELVGETDANEKAA